MSEREAKDRPLLSACLIVRDEEHTLGRCLSSLAGLADEIVVVDTGSTDATVEIARSFGCRVFTQPWTDDFSYHRNYSLDQATGQWLLILDADEEIVETDTSETRSVLAAGQVPSVLLVKERLLYPQSRAVTLLLPRLVRSGQGFRFVHPVHEQLDVAHETQMLSNVTILHHGYVSEEETRGKEERNLRLALGMNDKDPHALHCRSRAGLSLGRWREVVGWCRDLVQHLEHPYLALEGAVLGALAADQLGDEEAFVGFVELGESLAPDSPDMRLLDVLKSLRRYEKTIQDQNTTEQSTFYRPWMFWHSLHRARFAIGVVAGRHDDQVVRQRQ
jgi:hypothetical protein